MTLKEYIDKYHKGKFGKFARVAGFNRVTVWRWMTGERTPEDGNISKITTATGGLVTIRDFVPETQATPADGVDA